MITLTRPSAVVNPSAMSLRLLSAIRVRQSTQLPTPPRCIVVHSTRRVRPGYGLACIPTTMRHIDLAPAVGATPLRALHLTPVTPRLERGELTDGTDGTDRPTDDSDVQRTQPIRVQESERGYSSPDATNSITTSGSDAEGHRGDSRRTDGGRLDQPSFSLSASFDRPERSRPMPLAFDDSEPFATKYTPRHLAEFHGNEGVITRLQRLAESPSECALLLSGATGTGKTTAPTRAITRYPNTVKLASDCKSHPFFVLYLNLAAREFYHLLFLVLTEYPSSQFNVTPIDAGTCPKLIKWLGTFEEKKRALYLREGFDWNPSRKMLSLTGAHAV